MSWRKFRVLVNGLPDDSRTVTAQIDMVRDEKDRPKSDGKEPTPRWGQINHQLQALRDDVRFSQHAIVSALAGLGGSKSSGKPPKPLNRPTDPRRQTASMRLAEFRRLEQMVMAPEARSSPGVVLDAEI